MAKASGAAATAAKAADVTGSPVAQASPAKAEDVTKGDPAKATTTDPEGVIGDANGSVSPTDGETATDGRKDKRPRSNQYVLEEWDINDLPQRKSGGPSGSRDSQLDKQVLEVMEKFPNGTGTLDNGNTRLVMIARYGNGGQGGVAAATTLRKRFAQKAEETGVGRGLVFTTRQLNDDERGVFVTYDPTATGVNEE